MRNFVRTWGRDQRGAAAAEFALLVVPLTLLIFAIIHLCLMGLAQNQLNFATEATARCMVVAGNASLGSITPPPCTSTATDLSYLRARYKGPTAAPIFPSDPDLTQKCTASGGSPQVVATATYVIKTGFVNLNVPLRASACFAY